MARFLDYVRDNIFQLALAALLGYVVAFFRRLIERARLRKATLRINKLLNKRNYSIGGHSYPITIINSAVEAYDLANLKFSVVTSGQVPDFRELASNRGYSVWTEAERVKQDARLKRNEYWDARNTVGLLSYVEHRVGSSELVGLEFFPYVGSYTDHLIAIELLKSLPSVERSVIIAAGRSDPDPLFSRLLAISVAIISYDGKLLFHTRGKKIKDGGRLMCGFGEGFIAADLIGSDSPAILVARRGLEEETGIVMSGAQIEKTLSYTAFVFNERLYEYYLVGCIDFSRSDEFKDRTASRIVESIRSGPGKDKFEIDEEVFIDFSDFQIASKALARMIATAGERMIEYGVVTAVQAFLHKYIGRPDAFQTLGLKVSEAKTELRRSRK